MLGKMRTTLTPAFTSAKMRHMFDLVRDCARTSTDFLLETFFVAIGCEMEMEMQDFYSRITNDTIASCAFGLKINSLFDRENVFYETGCRIQELSSMKAFIKISGLRVFPWLFKKLNIEFVDADMRKVFSDLVLQNIEERRKNQITRADLIDLLLQAINGSVWSNDEIISQAFVFFLAGFDTSMWVILALTYELALNQEIQNRLISEIDATNRELDGNEITYDTLKEIKYLDMVVMETLRKHSPAVLIDRLCSKRFHLTDGDAINVQIEKGDHIWVPIYCFHHNPNYWKQPEIFDPERFNDENRKNINQAHYVPFGLGPRKCIGSRFALMEVKLIIYYMLCRFSFKATARTEVPMKIKSSPFGLTSVNGLILSVTRRK